MTIMLTFLWIEKSFFVLDTDASLVHMFKKATDKKPFKSLSLVHGKINQDENQVIIDGKTGERVQYFEFQFMDASGKKKSETSR